MNNYDSGENIQNRCVPNINPGLNQANQLFYPGNTGLHNHAIYQRLSGYQNIPRPPHLVYNSSGIQPPPGPQQMLSIAQATGNPPIHLGGGLSHQPGSYPAPQFSAPIAQYPQHFNQSTISNTQFASPHAHMTPNTYTHVQKSKFMHLYPSHLQPVSQPAQPPQPPVSHHPQPHNSLNSVSNCPSLQHPIHPTIQLTTQSHNVSHKPIALTSSNPPSTQFNSNIHSQTQLLASSNAMSTLASSNNGVSNLGALRKTNVSQATPLLIINPETNESLDLSVYKKKSIKTNGLKNDQTELGTGNKKNSALTIKSPPLKRQKDVDKGSVSESEESLTTHETENKIEEKAQNIDEGISIKLDELRDVEENLDQVESLSVEKGLQRYIYTRDKLLKIGKNPESRIRPKGLDKKMVYCETIILDSPMDSAECLQAPPGKFKINNRGGGSTSSGNQGSGNHWRINPNKAYANTGGSHVHQKYINLGNEELPSLEHSEDGYMTIRQRMAQGEALNESEELIRQIKGILNKIVPQNFDQCLNDLVNLKIGTHEGMNCLVNELFLKAVKEETYSVTFASMCNYLANIKADVSENEIVTFRSVLLQKCQTMFTTPLEEQLEKVRRDWLDRAETEKPKRKALMISDVEEQVKKAKDRYFGNIRFIGELYLRGVLITKIICFCIDNLMMKENDADSLICLCKLLETCGSKLEKETKGRDKLNESFNNMERLTNSINVEKRVRFRIMDVMEMRRQNWSQRKVQQEQKVEPKTLDEMKIEKEQQALEKDNMTHYHSLNRKSTHSNWTNNDRRMSVPATSASRGRLSNITIGSSFAPKNLTLSKPGGVVNEQGTLAPQNRNWNKGSGVKAKYDCQENIPEMNKLGRSRYKASVQLYGSGSIPNVSAQPGTGESIHAQSSASANASGIGGVASVSNTAGSSSHDSSRSSSSHRQQQVLTTSSTSGSAISSSEFGTSNISKVSVKSESKEQNVIPINTTVYGDTTKLVGFSVSENIPDIPEVGVTKQSTSNELFASEDLLDMYIKGESFCDDSWCSYEDKAGVVYQWLDSSIENSSDIRTSISDLLIKLVERNLLDKNDLLKAFFKLMESLEDLRIDIGPSVWRYFSDYLIHFFESNDLYVLDSIFNSKKINLEEWNFENAIEFCSLPWCMLNQEARHRFSFPSVSLNSRKNTNSLNNSSDSELFNNSEFVSRCVQRTATKLIENVNPNCLSKYTQWIEHRLSESFNVHSRQLFILANWFELYNNMLSADPKDCGKGSQYSKFCECLFRYTKQKEHLLAIQSLTKVKGLIRSDVLLLLWYLYLTQEPSCDLKVMSEWWCEYCTSESLLSSNLMKTKSQTEEPDITRVDVSSSFPRAFKQSVSKFSEGSNEKDSFRPVSYKDFEQFLNGVYENLRRDLNRPVSSLKSHDINIIRTTRENSEAERASESTLSTLKSSSTSNLSHESGNCTNIQSMSRSN